MKVALKLLISAILLYFVIRQIDLKRVLDTISHINIFYFLLAFVFYNLSKILSAIRLNLFFKEIGIELPFKVNLKLYYMGMFYNLFLPGGIGGDGYKAYLLKKHLNKKIGPIVKALFFDRVSGLVALIFLAALLFLFSDYAIFPLNYIAFAVAVLIYPLFYYISLKKSLFMKYFKKSNILGFLVQLLQLFSALGLIFALGQNLPIIEYLVLFLISSVVSVLPITIGGVGVREFTFLYGLKFINQPVDSAIAFSFLFFLITALSSLIGIIYIDSHKCLKKLEQNKSE